MQSVPPTPLPSPPQWTHHARLLDHCAFQVLDSCGYFADYRSEKPSNHFDLLEASLDISNTEISWEPQKKNKRLLPSSSWYSPQQEEQEEEEDAPPYLGKFVPFFSNQFYHNLARLLVCANKRPSFQQRQNATLFETDALEQGNLKHVDDDMSSTFESSVQQEDTPTQTEEVSPATLFHFSFYRQDYTVRATHIIKVCMDQTDLSFESSSTLQSDSSSLKTNEIFLHHLLYCSVVEPNMSTDNNHSVPIHTDHITLSILRALFRQYYSLPHLEAKIHELTRKLRNSLFYSNASLNHRTSHNSSNYAMSHVSMPSSTTDERTRFMDQIQNFQNRLEQELKQHIYELEYILGLCYKMGHSSLRSSCRLMMGQFLHSFTLGARTVLKTSFTTPRSHTMLMGDASMGLPRNIGIEDTQAAGIDSMLRILLRILKGIPLPLPNMGKIETEQISSSLYSSYIDLLFAILLPLHKPSGLVLWRDQTPILELYHETLVQCIGTLLLRDPRLLPKVIADILHPDIWPSEGGGASSTPKMVLLLHEIDTYIALLDTMTKQYSCTEVLYPMFSHAILPLSIRIGSCISSDNSRTSERALQFFKNQQFVGLVHFFFSSTGNPLVRSLLRVDTGMDLPWNPTVRRMTLLVLRELEAHNSTAFRQVCETLFSIQKTKPSPQVPAPVKGDLSLPFRLKESTNDTVSSSTVPATAFTTYKNPAPLGPIPPTVPRNRNASRMIAMTEFTGRPSLKKQMQMKADSSNNPPLTITGVAPWAMKASQEKPAITMELNPSLDAISDDVAVGESSWPKVVKFMDQLEVKDETSNQGNTQTGLQYDSMGASPILLPNLKFHDLVFGHELGTGAFSTVKYARLIIKGKSQSTWPEYAVKIVSNKKIQELGYESSISREISVLQRLSHPSIARLVSSFRFRDGAYLILEYASGGDLHSLLKRSGSLDIEATRFIIGELVSALYYIHQQGLVYADLKPENILLTKCGHVKLTDFGACRPCTLEARQSLKRHGRDLFQRLRDGDWKAASRGLNTVWDETFSNTTESDSDDDYIQNLRIEGTTAYLPPEVILGALPNQATDSWALGCVAFYLSQGRPPMLEDDEAATKQKIVTFDLSTIHDEMPRESSAINDSIKAFISKLLLIDPIERLTMEDALKDDFFNAIDVLNLHKSLAPPLTVGLFAPKIDARWNRRQFSSIWAPQPREYHVSDSLSRTADHQHEEIVELDESGSTFTSLQAI